MVEQVKQEAIDRLKASDKELGERLKREGAEFGREWASDDASAEELRRLQREEEDNPIEALEALGAALGWDVHVHADFVSSAPPDVEEPEFIEGFVEGALEVWKAVP